jgi:hypothetical protein
LCLLHQLPFSFIGSILFLVFSFQIFLVFFLQFSLMRSFHFHKGL